jgi:hypothetical protein
VRKVLEGTVGLNTTNNIYDQCCQIEVAEVLWELHLAC